MASREEAEDLGTKLFQAIFAGELGVAFERCRQTQGDIMLNIRPLELSSFPFELLFDPYDHLFFVMRKEWGVVRVLDVMRPARELIFNISPSILHVWSSPPDLEPLEIKAEFGSWGLVTSLGNATSRRLRNVLTSQSQQFEILHFDGHAGFETDTETGFIVLEDKEGHSRILTANILGDYLANTSVKLVVLAGCESAAQGKKRFAGLAQHLIAASDVVAVVAYQWPIEDSAASSFNEAFYKALARGAGIKEAMTEGRWAIRDERVNLVEALTPVLYMR